jgi:ABC-2 type transport system permease protein
VLRNSLRGRRAVQVVAGGVVGLILAVLTMLMGLIDFDDQAVAVDLLAGVFAVVMVGWFLVPILLGGGDETLRAEHFTLLPLRPRRIAVGLFAAGFVGIPPIATLVALFALVLHAGRLGVLPLLVGAVFTVLLLFFVILLSRVMLAAVGALLTSRKGRDLGILLVALFGLSGVAVNYLANSVVPALIQRRADGLSVVLHVLPSGWGPVAVQASSQGEWGTVALLLAGMVLLLVALMYGYSALLVRRTTTAAYTGGSDAKRGKDDDGERRGFLPPTPIGAVVGKEVRTWWRDARRRLALASTVIVGIVLAVVPSFANGGHQPGVAGGAVPFLAIFVAVFACLQAGNLYGYDGSALWLTLVTPGAERVDVRGRQLAWLLIVAPFAALLAIALPAAAGKAFAYPWVLGFTPAVLGGGAGMLVLLSVYVAFPVPDQRKNSNPFVSGGRPGCARGALQLGMLLVLALSAVPPGAVLIIGSVTDSAVLRWLGVPIGIATGIGLAWWWGRLAYRRLAARGPELFDIVRKER